MTVFDSLKCYGNAYKVKDSRNFTPEEVNMVSSAKVINGEYGLSVCFFMKAGGTTYIPVSRDSVVSVGDTVDLTKAKLLTLSKEDSKDINRVEI